MPQASKTWTKLKDDKLYRHQSGIHYARLTVNGKQTWRSLKTRTLDIARVELHKLLEEGARLKELGVDPGAARAMTGAELIKLQHNRIANKADIKPSTVHYWNQVIRAFVKSWPQFETTEVRKISEEDCQAWAGRTKETTSPSRFNSMVCLLKNMLVLAVRKGARRINPAETINRRKESKKNLSDILPSNQQFNQMVDLIRNGGGRFSKACADLVELLAYTGLRIGEARWLRWSHCNFDKGVMMVVGAPETGTKNGEVRFVPMIPAARDLLERMRQVHVSPNKTEKVLFVFEAQKAIDRACKVLGLERFTHHDLRHLFATRCIESGIDIPTVSKWLGHKDGGVLAMKVYGHLRNEHSLASAAKVSFA